MQADNQIGESLTAQSSQEVAIEQPSSRLRLKAYHLLLWGIRQGGAAFIKWGQWSATREDMFPPELCRVLAELHDHAPVHSWRESKREIEASFKRPVEELFESIDHEPLASGSIAQVFNLPGVSCPPSPYHHYFGSLNPTHCCFAILSKQPKLFHTVPSAKHCV